MNDPRGPRKGGRPPARGGRSRDPGPGESYRPLDLGGAPQPANPRAPQPANPRAPRVPSNPRTVPPPAQGPPNEARGRRPSVPPSSPRDALPGGGAPQRPRTVPPPASPAPAPPASGALPPAREAREEVPEAPAPRRFYLTAAPADDEDEDDALGPSFPEYTWSERAYLANVASVRRVDGERPVPCEAGDLSLRKGESVVIESERGLELALVVIPARRQMLESRPPVRAVRRAAEADLATEARTRLREADAVRAARETVQALDLPVKVVRAEVALSGGRTTVYIASEDRVELRELARRLTASLRGRVEIRHVGMRDAARVTGGIGPCGLQLCCNTFLADFAPVSIRMAKDQGLALNPQRVSGVCGRLMCCLVYEDAFYRQQRALFPRQGKLVHTPRGEGRVRDVDVLGRTVRVYLAEGGMEAFPVDEVRSVHGPNSGREPREEREERGGRDGTDERGGGETGGRA